MVNENRAGRDAVAESQQVRLCGKTQIGLLLGKEGHQTSVAPCHGMLRIRPHRAQDGLHSFAGTTDAKPSLAVPPVGAELAAVLGRQPVWPIWIASDRNHVLLAEQTPVARYERVRRGGRHYDWHRRTGGVCTTGPVALGKAVRGLLETVLLLISLQEQSFVVGQHNFLCGHR